MTRKIREGNVPNKPLREAFLRSGLSTYEVAAFCGWLKGKDLAPDCTRIERVLGLRSYKSRGHVITSRSCSEKSALEIIEAIGLDPVDFREIGL